MNKFENDAIKDDQLVEITDLDPIESTSRFSRMFIALEKRPSLRKRFWRIATVCGTVLLILLMFFSTVSSVRGLAFSFFAGWQTCLDRSLKLSLSFLKNERISRQVCHPALIFYPSPISSLVLVLKSLSRSRVPW